MQVGKNYKWIDLAILGLCTAALLGGVLRTKIVFSLPFINYNNLLEAHSHFTFGGWVTLVLLVLMVFELLPEPFNKRPAYQWVFGSVFISSWGMLLAFLFVGYNTISILFSTAFIITTYIFGWIFIRDALNAKLGKSVLLLSISSIFCLLISSTGPIIITYIYYTKSFGGIIYRDALFTYLHFQYNGFFSLAIFALLFNLIPQPMPSGLRRKIQMFGVVMVISIIPSLFLSYLWQNPDLIFRLIAVLGGCVVLLSLILFVNTARSLKSNYNHEKPVVRFLVFLSMTSFALKVFLQGFTIFPVIGNAIFGNRPVIMGFLHLVFLGFVSLFILAFLGKKGILDTTQRFTKIALIEFALSVIVNEILLITQGLSAIFIPGSFPFAWLLWVAAIGLFSGSIFIAIARIKTRKMT
jgi:hypothetical protein